MQSRRRPAKVQFLGDRNEIAKMPQLEIDIHIWIILIARNKILDVINQKPDTKYGRVIRAPRFERHDFSRAAKAAQIAGLYRLRKNSIWRQAGFTSFEKAGFEVGGGFNRA